MPCFYAFQYSEHIHKLYYSATFGARDEFWRFTRGVGRCMLQKGIVSAAARQTRAYRDRDRPWNLRGGCWAAWRKDLGGIATGFGVYFLFHNTCAKRNLRKMMHNVSAHIHSISGGQSWRCTPATWKNEGCKDTQPCEHGQDRVAALAFLRREEEYAEAPRPNLILLHLNLPKNDGRDVLAEIKTDPILRCIPVVVLTGSRDKEDMLKSYNLYANCYITKPVNPEQFIKVVRSIEDFWLTIVKLPRVIKWWVLILYRSYWSSTIQETHVSFRRC